MSTRSIISVNLDGQVFTAYCHFDGYVAGVGETLVNHYNSLELARALVLGGDMSSVEETLAGIRRYTDGGSKYRCVSDSQFVPGLYDLGHDYEYLFKDGVWYYREAQTTPWTNLEDAVVEINLEKEDY